MYLRPIWRELHIYHEFYITNKSVHLTKLKNKFQGQTKKKILILKGFNFDYYVFFFIYEGKIFVLIF